jgi:hypothetical protein
MQREILAEHFGDSDACKERRKRLTGSSAAVMSAEPMMLRCLNVLGVGVVSAFALLCRHRERAPLRAPGKTRSLHCAQPRPAPKRGVQEHQTRRGQKRPWEIRHLLIQGAQAALRMGRATALGQWGWKLFARKGNRNVAVTAVARKLLVQVWHMLSGNPPTALETDKSFTLKLHKLAVVLGAPLGREYALKRADIFVCDCQAVKDKAKELTD